MSSQSVRTKLYFIESYNFASQHQNAIQHEKENFIVYQGIKLSKEQLEEFIKK